jgi:hypothetical protein
MIWMMAVVFVVHVFVEEMMKRMFVVCVFVHD